MGNGRGRLFCYICAVAMRRGPWHFRGSAQNYICAMLIGTVRKRFHIFSQPLFIFYIMYSASFVLSRYAGWRLRRRFLFLALHRAT